MARPTKFCDERTERLLSALRAGNTRRAAAAFAGVSDDTLERWEQRYADFAEAIKKAEASAEVQHVAIVAQAAQSGVWQASAWWLERRRPADYGRRERVDLNVIRSEAQRLAEQLGLDVDEVVSEARRILHGER